MNVFTGRLVISPFTFFARRERAREWIDNNSRACVNRVLSHASLFRNPNLMLVTVVDRASMNRKWGAAAFRGVEKVDIYISRDCPVCGEPRGVPRPTTFHEFGEHYSVDTWTNACGHVDKYRDLLTECRRLAIRPVTGITPKKD